ncbi:hypothetical protein ACHAWC_005711 [Mediolabrus comicus]
MSGNNANVVVLFPWLACIIGCLVYYITSRLKIKIPYTSIMFIVGTIMGFFAQEGIGGGRNAVTESTSMWTRIDGELLLLVFLPGLLFLDSYNINVYLFKKAFWQLLLFAFPISLCGTILTAIFAKMALPYDWSINLCLLLGSVLSATDPVAVAVLLDDTGAPPRLRTHIAGESLLNDGASLVFFKISLRSFLHEMGVHGVEDIGWFRGIALFLRLSLGGTLVGVIFGLVLVTILFNLNRRLSREECVFQVTATIAIAYLSYFVSEVLLHCSGILSVVFCGVTTKMYGATLFNDAALARDFISIFEKLLNTTIFTVGGAVWSSVIPSFTISTDWMYLILLYTAVVVIRVLLMTSFYPISSRIGVGTSPMEMIFISWSGLRGAVGIALALLLSAEVFEYSQSGSDGLSDDTRRQYLHQVQKLFGHTGGISFLSLIIQGTTSGPLLRALGLVASTETRDQVLNNYEKHLQRDLLVDYMLLLCEKRFEHLDYGIVKKHVSILREVSPTIFQAAIDCFRSKYPSLKLPDVSNISMHLLSETDQVACEIDRSCDSPGVPNGEQPSNEKSATKRDTLYDASHMIDEASLTEERKIFVESMKTEYHNQLSNGLLDSRSAIPFTLLESLQCAEEEIANGRPMNDWAALQNSSLLLDRALHSYRVGSLCNRQRQDDDFCLTRTKVLQALSFIKAHLASQSKLKAEFSSIETRSLSLTEKKVLDESREQVARADACIDAFDAQDVNAIKSQYCCQVLLHKSARYFERLVSSGLVTESEASLFLDKYDEELRELRLSSEFEVTRDKKQAAANLDSMT